MLPTLPMSLPPTNFDTVSYVQTPTPALQPAAPPAAKPAEAKDESSLGWGIVGGIARGILGTSVYVAFIQATHIRIGYLAILVAFLVAKCIMIGSKAKGGLEYQLTAVLMTYGAVSVGSSINIYLELAKIRAIDLTLNNILVLLKLGAAEPFLRFQSSGPRAVIGLLILFVGLRAAWRMTSGDPEAMHHPFTR